jgi:hypothetical protein
MARDMNDGMRHERRPEATSTSGSPRRRRGAAPQDASVASVVTARDTSGDTSVYTGNRLTLSGDGGGDHPRQHPKTMISSDPTRLGRRLT